ncbi:unnamed protein product [Darwinula stevensoni]|uniref:Transmembrane protein 94 n=1 Tax=Darwinula stevensoni TaxID=69355 RepID=A0A7R8XFX8_9CRUS|nr:unnamed protein product [Darwinula stevensoni]CAG0889218.1 unnamed protein product [Darwinula stevensoni]
MLADHKLEGLASRDALSALSEKIDNVLQDFEKSKKKESWFGGLCVDSIMAFNLLSFITILLECVFLLTSYFTLPKESVTSLPGLLDAKHSRHKIEKVSFPALRDYHYHYNWRAEYMAGWSETICWKEENYPHLHMPLSPCITLQWTIRDGKLVNLPWALLVEGDTVLLRPGQEVPGHCSQLKKSGADEQGDGKRSLHFGDIYSPLPMEKKIDMYNVPKLRQPLEANPYIMLETPYLEHLRHSLSRGHLRPKSAYEDEQHLIWITCIHTFAIPIVAIGVAVINLVRLNYAAEWSGELIEILLLYPALCTIPLLPLMFPMVWIALNMVGMSRNGAEESQTQSRGDVFEDIEALKEFNAPYKLDKQLLLHTLYQLSLGKDGQLWLSSNLLHVLASLSALCCVDKKGILSWPNPTADKVFFFNGLRKSLHEHVHQEHREREGAAHLHRLSDVRGDLRPEVLDMTHDPHTPFQLHFDDPSWKQHLSSLKPLGLSILLNTCNEATRDHYMQFCSHITWEALHNENLVPVINRRKEEDMQEELVRSNRLAKSLAYTKLKFPFPHMVAVVVKDLPSGMNQLMSQGTADIILDSCSDVWDGKDLFPLTNNLRKKILDFYHRSSLTAYCTAFAYRPMMTHLSPTVCMQYLELPADGRLPKTLASPAPSASVPWENITGQGRLKTLLGQHVSTGMVAPSCISTMQFLSLALDSLLCTNDGELDEVDDAEGCARAQQKQIFLGIVTMQYQARLEAVRLIEVLDRACIRFVHFSKENELRSRVFSEKMGLESGWNCHISLLSDRHRVVLEEKKMKSYSAPGDLNFEPSTVPFDPRPTVHLDNEDSSNHMYLHPPEKPRKRCESEVMRRSLRYIDNPVPIESSEDEGLLLNNSHESIIGSNLSSSESISHLSESSERSAPVPFDMSNRAKLPRGIEAIRPHLSQVDNVPLQVSLFTDCTAEACKEMLSIMQEYGQVVCVVGSTASIHNTDVFLQADAAYALSLDSLLGVVPLYPQVCMKIPSYQVPAKESEPPPTEVSHALTSLPCALNFHVGDSLPLSFLILEARAWMQGTRNCLQLWLTASISLALLQVISAVILLPPILSPAHVCWLSLVIIPIQCIPLALKWSPDQNLITEPMAKLQLHLNSELLKYILWCYGAKFLPSIIILVFVFTLTLSSFCEGLFSHCNLVYPEDSTHPWGGWSYGVSAIGLLIAQNYVTCLFVFYMGLSLFHGSIILMIIRVSHSEILSFLFVALISACFVHRMENVWHRSPLSSRAWVICSMIRFSLQWFYHLFPTRKPRHKEIVLYSTAEIFISKDAEVVIPGIPLFSWLLGFIWPLPLIAFNEAFKRHEIKVNVRYLKRARLAFGTKLGMNSPF